MLFKFFLLLIWVTFESLVAYAQAGSLEHDSIQEIERVAAGEARKWDREARERSIQLYLRAADEREKLNQPARSADCLRKAAHQHLVLGDNNKAFQKLNRALELDKISGDAGGRPQTLSLLSLVALRSGQSRQSKGYLDEALSRSSSSDDPNAAGDSVL